MPKCFFGKHSMNRGTYIFLFIEEDDCHQQCLRIVFDSDSSKIFAKMDSFDVSMAEIQQPREILINNAVLKSIESYYSNFLKMIDLLEKMVHFVDVSDGLHSANLVIWGTQECSHRGGNPYYQYWFVVTDHGNNYPKPKYFVYDPILKQLDIALELDDSIAGLVKVGGACRGLKDLKYAQNQYFLDHFTLRDAVMDHLHSLVLQYSSSK